VHKFNKKNEMLVLDPCYEKRIERLAMALLVEQKVK